MTLNVKRILLTPNFNPLLSYHHQKSGVGLKSHSKSYNLIGYNYGNNKTIYALI